MKVIFVAGTDTACGKTLIAGAMARAFLRLGYRVGVMKPVSCGGPEDAHYLTQCAAVQEPLWKVNPIRLRNPWSPNVAAHFERKKIHLSWVDRAQKDWAKHCDLLVVEGCGGVLVPLTKNFFVVDLIARLQAQTVLVSRSALGAINHCLLSLEALKRRKISVRGVIFNRLQGGALSMPEKTNPAVVSSLGAVRSLGVFPYAKNCSPEIAGDLFLKHIDFKKILC